MDKSDYSEVKELITNCPPSNNSPFDGVSVGFYGSTKDDSCQKNAGHLRSFRKVGVDIASRHDFKGTYNNQRLEKEPPSSWAMVNEVGHSLHFSEATVDIAFVTKNALALRDAHSRESLTAPFKSIQTQQKPPPAAEESQPTFKHQNGNNNNLASRGSTITTAIATNNSNNSNNGNGNGNGNIFSFNRNVKGMSTEEPPYDDDSNFEKESSASFEFNRHRSNANINPLTKPAPSKWDDAEKWLSSVESAPAKTRPKSSPLAAAIAAAAAASVATPQSARKGEVCPNPDVDFSAGVDVSMDGLASPDVDNHTVHPGFDVEDTSPEKVNKFQLVDCTKKVEAGSKKSLLPRFTFMSGKPLPLPLPMAPVDRYPLEDVFVRDDDSNARESSDVAPEPFSVRTAKPTAGITGDATAKAEEENGDEPPLLKPSAAGVTAAAYATSEAGAGVVNMRTVCMRDMGTEMTPMASVDPSRTATPLMATTPNLGSPAISRPTSPGRVRTTTPTSTASSASKHTNLSNKLAVAAAAAGPKALDAAAAAAAGTVSSAAGLTGKEKTRAEILALGTQLGKANIAAWATKEEEEADAAQALKASLEMEEVRKNLLASRAAAWEEAEQAKYTARFKREEAKIQALENHEKAKAEAEMRRVEVKVERMRSHANETLMNKLAAARRRAEDLRAKAEAVRCEQATKTTTQSEQIRRTGRVHTSFFSHFCK